MIPRHVSFVRGTGQSLERYPRLKRGRLRIPNTLRRGSSLPVYGKTQYTAQDPERIAAHAIGYPQGEKVALASCSQIPSFTMFCALEKAALASCSRKAAHDGTALESLVACLQPLTHVVIYACRSTPFAGHPKQREREMPPAPATPTQRKTAVPVHDLHDWNSRPLVPVLPSPAFFWRLVCNAFAVFCSVAHSPKL